MIQCPACKRHIEARPTACPRCGMDLDQLYRLLDEAERRARRGRACLQRGEMSRALHEFRFSVRIRRSERATKGLAVAAMCAGSYEEALRSYLALDESFGRRGDGFRPRGANPLTAPGEL